MPEASTIKLPLLFRKRRLPALPGQPDGASYGIVSHIRPEPAASHGYVVEYLRGSRARILACITDDGRAFQTDAPIAEFPERAADLSIATEGQPDRGGIFTRAPAGGHRRIGAFATVAGLFRTDGDGSWQEERGLPYREFLAALYLRFCAFAPESGRTGISTFAAAPEEGAIPADIALERLERPVELFEGFRSLPLADAIEALLFRIDAQEEPSGIERYARRVLAPFDLARLRELSQRQDVSLARIERTSSFYIIFDRPRASSSDMAFMLALETALNRLSGILDVIGSGLEPLRSSPSEEGCSLIDQRILRSSGDAAGSVFDLVRQPNAWGAPGTVESEAGGEWDVRTRMAHLLEGMDLHASLECRFRYDSARAAIGVEFAAPSARMLTSEVYDAREGAWRPIDGDVSRAMADELAHRMALSLAAAGFAAGVAIRRCIVRTRPLDGEGELVLAFSRAAFLATQLPLARELDRRSLASGFLRDALGSSAAAPEGPELAIFSPPSDGRAADPRHDRRPLPPVLRDMLLADTADELEVMEDEDDPFMRRVAALHELAARDRAGAVEGLRALTEELQARCAAAEALADGPAVSRYSDGYFARMLLGLDEEDRRRRIIRAPDALYHAQMEVAALLSRSERFEEAVVEARRLVDMAPTSSGAHFALINALARLERYDEVIEVVRHGLSVAFERDAAEYYFYRMAFAYWHRGDRETALACYRMVPAHGGIGESAMTEMRQLMAEMGRSGPPSEAEARERLALMEISVPPIARVHAFLSDAAVLLCDNGFLFLAARCCFEMWRSQGDDELGMVCKSLNW